MLQQPFRLADTCAVEECLCAGSVAQLLQPELLVLLMFKQDPLVAQLSLQGALLYFPQSMVLVTACKMLCWLAAADASSPCQRNSAANTCDRSRAVQVFDAIGMLKFA